MEPRHGDRRGREGGQGRHHELAGTTGEQRRVIDLEAKRDHVMGLPAPLDDERTGVGRRRSIEDREGSRDRAKGGGGGDGHGRRCRTLGRCDDRWGGCLDGRWRHGQQLLADIDPDRAPRDAAPAADAAGHPELIPPGAELVGEPLAIAVLRPRPEVAAGHLGEPEREAAVPRPLGDRLDAVEVRDLA